MSLRSEHRSVHLPFRCDDTHHYLIDSREKIWLHQGTQLLRAWTSCFNHRHKSYTKINAQSCQPDTERHSASLCHVCWDAVRADGGGGPEGMNETHLSVFHSALNRGKRSRNRISSAARYAFNSFFLVSSKRLYDIHVKWFDRFLHRKADSTKKI